MEHISPEENTHSSADSLPFIGPHDAYDDGREFLLRKIEGLAHIALTNLAPSALFHAELATEVMAEMNKGHLRLSKEYPNMDAHQQMARFIDDHFQATLRNSEEIVNVVNDERLQTITAMQKTAVEQNNTIIKLRAERIEAQLTLLRIKQGLIEGNITDDLMGIFNKLAKITAPAIFEAEEHPKSSTGKFWNIVSQLSRKTFESMGIVAPKSAEVTIIHQNESISRQ